MDEKQETKPEGKKTVEETIQDDLEINDEKIVEELKNQPGLFFYYATMSARASRARRKAKLKAKESEAALVKDFRQRMNQEQPGVRVTERMIDEYLSAHPDYIAMNTRLIDLEYTEDMLTLARDAFKERHQALMEISRAISDERIYGNEIEHMRNQFEKREVKQALEKRRGRRKSETTETKEEQND